jgi:hypothetical protein
VSKAFLRADFENFLKLSFDFINSLDLLIYTFLTLWITGLPIFCFLLLAGLDLGFLGLFLLLPLDFHLLAFIGIFLLSDYWSGMCHVG